MPTGADHAFLLFFAPFSVQKKAGQPLGDGVNPRSPARVF